MRTRADGGAAEVLQAASEVHLLVVVLQGGGSGHGLGAFLVLTLVLVLVFGPAMWRWWLGAPRQLLENLPCFGPIARGTFGQNLLRVQIQTHATGCG